VHLANHLTIRAWNHLTIAGKVTILGKGTAKKFPSEISSKIAFPNQLKWAVERTRLPMKLLPTIDEDHPLEMIEAARRLLHNEDKKTNYLYVKHADRGNGKPFSGYVFNSSHYTYGRRAEYSMTPKRAHFYLRALVGRIPPNLDLEATLEITHACHLVEIMEDSIFTCDCRGFSQHGECYHWLAALSLSQHFDYEAASGRVIKGRVRGRERAYEDALGFEAHDPYPDRLTTHQLSSQTRRRVAHDEFDDKGKLIRTYVGRVTGVHSLYKLFQALITASFRKF